MNTLAISQLSTLRWSIEQDVHAYSRRGFSGIGIYRPKLEDYGLDRTIELLAEFSLSATSLSWVGGFTGSDGRAFGDAVADAIAAIDDAANLRADTLIVLAGGRNNHIRNHARRTLCEALKEIAAVAEDYDVRISLEPIHPGCGDEWSFVNDLQSTLDIIETVNSPALGVVLDTYHVGMDEEVVRWLPDIVPHLHLVQLGDARHSPLGEMNRCLLGKGCVPIHTILQTLNQYQFRGPFEVELLGEDVESFSYDEILDHTRNFMDRMRMRVQHDSRPG
ncbi:MAG: sugar phosphate isomerase/epimerase [Pirellulaceae bacterium]|nr:sugar phosphate isomerase/epimerase [Pirellulaceae bacterium]